MTQHEHFDMKWDKVKAVIFDVDGTLYTQSKLRKKMLLALLRYYAVRPWRFSELLILHHFRAEREKRTGNPCNDLENAQYHWCTEKGNFPAQKVKAVVEHWMFRFPNQYLRSCMYPGTKDFFDVLRSKGIKIGIYSDYKAHDKLKAMGLKADIVVCSTDPHIDRLKPDPRGLQYITEKLGLTPQECLFIGDRPELDGECAQQANMPHLIVDKKPFDAFDFYYMLSAQLTTTLIPRHHETERL